MTSKIAIVTPSYAPDFELCRELNASVMTHLPAPMRHYLIVDGKDLKLFQRLESDRTNVIAIEDVIPRAFLKLAYPPKLWFSRAAMFPAKGWLIQQVAKLSMAWLAEEPVLVNVDSDVRFVRPIDPRLFADDGKTRFYRLPDGVTPMMPHVKWNRNVCRILGIPADTIPPYDYVGNVISWDRRLVLDACARVELVTGTAWHVAFTRARLVSEYFLYGLYLDRVVGRESAPVWTDSRSWCHTYWGPGPLLSSDVRNFVESMRDDEIAFSIAGYTATDRAIVSQATSLALRRVADRSSNGVAM